MIAYPPLPELTPRTAGESLHTYGGRVIAFVVAHRCTATLSTDDLELADHVYPIAVGHPELTPIAAERLTDARHAILTAIRWRAAERAADVDADQAPSGPTIQPASQDKGRLVPLRPRPFSRPPAGVAIDVAF